VFAKGKALGPHGLEWLKIHLVNLTGFKKRSLHNDYYFFCPRYQCDLSFTFCFRFHFVFTV